MIKTLLKCITVTFVALILLIITTFISVNSKSVSRAKAELTQTKAAKYTLSEYDGKIALYKQGSAMPVEIYDIYIDSLPQEEREKVKSGISADTDAQIIKLIEAYTS